MDRRRSSGGFTLLELVVTLLILSAVIVVVGLRSGTFSFWKDEGLVRRLVELSTFLHHQAVVDQRFYALRFRFGQNGSLDSFTVGTFASQADAGTTSLSGSRTAPNSGQTTNSPSGNGAGGRLDWRAPPVRAVDCRPNSRSFYHPHSMRIAKWLLHLISRRSPKNNIFRPERH
jgi:prepilin-type N-terminal cleavage/methylation domain-containing protein